MKKSITTLLAVLLAAHTTFAQAEVSFTPVSLQQLWESDSVTLKGPESVLFDPQSRSLFVSSMGSGSIVRMDRKGKVIRKDWVKGLNSNKGSALYNGLLYTAETAAVAVIDVQKAVVVKRIPVTGAIMLNDLAVDAKGIIYVTDTRAGTVYRIEGDTPVLYLRDLPGANGLFTAGTDLYVAAAASFHKIDAQKVMTTIADGFESGLDGIVMIAPNEFLLSNYKGMLYQVHGNGGKELLMDTRAKGVMANDISYDNKTRTLFVPSYGTNRIIAYRVK